MNSRGAREIHPSLDEMNQVRSKKSKGFSSQNRKFKWFFWSKTSDLQKKRSSPKLQQIFRPKSRIPEIYPKNVTKSGVSSPKTLIWTSICAPEAPSLLISFGHSLHLGGHNFRLGGTSSQLGGAAPVCLPVAQGLVSCVAKSLQSK